MTFWRQLRWRIVATNMLVVLVGVTIVLLMAYLGTRLVVPQLVSERVAELLAAGEETTIAAAQQALLDAFRNSIFTAVLIAGLCALVAGILASFWLSNEILRPLRQIAHSSQRIASGHYDERVPRPASDELAQVAEHFNRMAEALARVEETRVALIGDVSHELRTPLTSLDGYLEGILDGLFPANEETVALMYGEVRRLRRLVDDLQTLSRVEAGEIALHLETFDVCEAVQRVVAQLQPQAVAQDLTVNICLPGEPLLVRADPDRTAQILLNLVGNALRYTPDGGEITITGSVEGRQVRVDVRDTGVGIAPEALPFLFERFYRVDRSRSRASGGSGIGLTISRHLAWAMGGDLSAWSEGEGRGSNFSLVLPGAVTGK